MHNNKNGRQLHHYLHPSVHPPPETLQITGKHATTPNNTASARDANIMAVQHRALDRVLLQNEGDKPRTSTISSPRGIQERRCPPVLVQPEQPVLPPSTFVGITASPPSNRTRRSGKHNPHQHQQRSFSSSPRAAEHGSHGSSTSSYSQNVFLGRASQTAAAASASVSSPTTSRRSNGTSSSAPAVAARQALQEVIKYLLANPTECQRMTTTAGTPRQLLLQELDYIVRTWCMVGNNGVEQETYETLRSSSPEAQLGLVVAGGGGVKRPVGDGGSMDIRENYFDKMVLNHLRRNELQFGSGNNANNTARVPPAAEMYTHQQEVQTLRQRIMELEALNDHLQATTQFDQSRTAETLVVLNAKKRQIAEADAATIDVKNENAELKLKLTKVTKELSDALRRSKTGDNRPDGATLSALFRGNETSATLGNIHTSEQEAKLEKRLEDSRAEIKQLYKHVRNLEGQNGILERELEDARLDRDEFSQVLTNVEKNYIDLQKASGKQLKDLSKMNRKLVLRTDQAQLLKKCIKELETFVGRGTVVDQLVTEHPVWSLQMFLQHSRARYATPYFPTPEEEEWNRLKTVTSNSITLGKLQLQKLQQVAKYMRHQHASKSANRSALLEQQQQKKVAKANSRSSVIAHPKTGGECSSSDFQSSSLLIIVPSTSGGIVIQEKFSTAQLVQLFHQDMVSRIGRALLHLSSSSSGIILKCDERGHNDGTRERVPSVVPVATCALQVLGESNVLIPAVVLKSMGATKRGGEYVSSGAAAAQKISVFDLWKHEGFVVGDCHLRHHHDHRTNDTTEMVHSYPPHDGYDDAQKPHDLKDEQEKHGTIFLDKDEQNLTEQRVCRKTTKRKQRNEKDVALEGVLVASLASLLNPRPTLPDMPKEQVEALMEIAKKMTKLAPSTATASTTNNNNVNVGTNNNNSTVAPSTNSSVKKEWVRLAAEETRIIREWKEQVRSTPRADNNDDDKLLGPSITSTVSSKKQKERVDQQKRLSSRREIVALLNTQYLSRAEVRVLLATFWRKRCREYVERWTEARKKINDRIHRCGQEVNEGADDTTISEQDINRNEKLSNATRKHPLMWNNFAESFMQFLKISFPPVQGGLNATAPVRNGGPPVTQEASAVHFMKDPAKDYCLVAYPLSAAVDDGGGAYGTAEEDDAAAAKKQSRNKQSHHQQQQQSHRFVPGHSDSYLASPQAMSALANILMIITAFRHVDAELDLFYLVSFQMIPEAFAIDYFMALQRIYAECEQAVVEGLLWSGGGSSESPRNSRRRASRARGGGAGTRGRGGEIQDDERRPLVLGRLTSLMPTALEGEEEASQHLRLRREEEDMRKKRLLRHIKRNKKLRNSRRSRSIVAIEGRDGRKSYSDDTSSPDSNSTTTSSTSCSSSEDDDDDDRHQHRTRDDDADEGDEEKKKDPERILQRLHDKETQEAFFSASGDEVRGVAKNGDMRKDEKEAEAEEGELSMRQYKDLLSDLGDQEEKTAAAIDRHRGRRKSRRQQPSPSSVVSSSRHTDVTMLGSSSYQHHHQQKHTVSISASGASSSTTTQLPIPPPPPLSTSGQVTLQKFMSIVQQVGFGQYAAAVGYESIAASGAVAETYDTTVSSLLVTAAASAAGNPPLRRSTATNEEPSDAPSSSSQLPQQRGLWGSPQQQLEALSTLMLQRLKFALGMDQPAPVIKFVSLFKGGSGEEVSVGGGGGGHGHGGGTAQSSHFCAELLRVRLDLFEQSRDALVQNVIIPSCICGGHVDDDEHYDDAVGESVTAMHSSSSMARPLSSLSVSSQQSSLHAKKTISDEMMFSNDSTQQQQQQQQQPSHPPRQQQRYVSTGSLVVSIPRLFHLWEGQVVQHHIREEEEHDHGKVVVGEEKKGRDEQHQQHSSSSSMMIDSYHFMSPHNREVLLRSLLLPPRGQQQVQKLGLPEAAAPDDDGEEEEEEEEKRCSTVVLDQNGDVIMHVTIDRQTGAKEEERGESSTVENDDEVQRAFQQFHDIVLPLAVTSSIAKTAVIATDAAGIGGGGEGTGKTEKALSSVSLADDDDDETSNPSNQGGGGGGGDHHHHHLIFPLPLLLARFRTCYPVYLTPTSTSAPPPDDAPFSSLRVDDDDEVVVTIVSGDDDRGRGRLNVVPTGEEEDAVISSLAAAVQETRRSMMSSVALKKKPRQSKGMSALLSPSSSPQGASCSRRVPRFYFSRSAATTLSYISDHVLSRGTLRGRGVDHQDCSSAVATTDSLYSRQLAEFHQQVAQECQQLEQEVGSEEIPLFGASTTTAAAAGIEEGGGGGAVPMMVRVACNNLLCTRSRSGTYSSVHQSNNISSCSHTTGGGKPIPAADGGDGMELDDKDDEQEIENIPLALFIEHCSSGFFTTGSAASDASSQRQKAMDNNNNNISTASSGSKDSRKSTSVVGSGDHNSNPRTARQQHGQPTTTPAAAAAAAASSTTRNTTSIRGVMTTREVLRRHSQWYVDRLIGAQQHQTRGGGTFSGRGVKKKEMEDSGGGEEKEHSSGSTTTAEEEAAQLRTLQRRLSTIVMHAGMNITN